MKTAVIMGTVLVVAGLAADVILTLRGYTVPAIVASVVTAGLGVVAPGLLALKGGQQ